jgi:hypothetical protein
MCVPRSQAVGLGYHIPAFQAANSSLAHTASSPLTPPTTQHNQPQHYGNERRGD